MSNFDHLVELRQLYALARVSIDEASADKRAPLIARAESIAKQIAELEAASGKVADPVDEIAARRAARGGATARPGRAKRGKG